MELTPIVWITDHGMVWYEVWSTDAVDWYQDDEVQGDDLEAEE